MNKKPFDRFEKLARQVVEGSLSRLLGAQLDVSALTVQVMQYLEEQIDRSMVLTAVQLILSATDKAHLLTADPLADQAVAAQLSQRLLHTDWPVTLPLKVWLMEDPDMRPGHIQVRLNPLVPATPHSGHTVPTQVQTAVDSADSLAALVALSAFLIVSGQENVSLTQPVITVGRAQTCDLVVNDVTMSRQHAQIRWRYGRFILHDLDSRHGTFINDQFTRQGVLKSGDVIRMGKTTFIYGEASQDNEAPPPDNGRHPITLVGRNDS